jgi:hypothetical protein
VVACRLKASPAKRRVKNLQLSRWRSSTRSS